MIARLRLPVLRFTIAAILAMLPTVAASAQRKAAAVSEIVIDAQTGRSLYASNAEQRRPPASLAKMMTLVLAFDALNAGKLQMTDKLVMTANGARQAPSRLGLARGKTMSVRDAIKAIAVISANDVAVALADRLGGSEAMFVRRMNQRAAQIGMTDTRFGNATGLTPGGGLTTARDMARLSRYIIRTYPERYKLFGTRSIRWKGWVRPNHNQLLGKVKGLDGLKTGYTVQAGFNLAASARRTDKRIIVVVMGARTGADRDLLVANLMESGFTSSAVLRTRTSRQEPRSKVPARNGDQNVAQLRRFAGDAKRAAPAKIDVRHERPRSEPSGQAIRARITRSRTPVLRTGSTR